MVSGEEFPNKTNPMHGWALPTLPVVEASPKQYLVFHRKK